MRLICGCLFGLAVVSSGCAARPLPPVSVPAEQPSFTEVDTRIYNTLLTIQAALEAAKVSIDAAPHLRDELNRAIADYNITMDLYKTYREFGTSQWQKYLPEVTSRLAALTAAVAVLYQKLSPQPA